MSWSLEQKLDFLLKMPWTIVPETSSEGDRLLRVREIPSAIGCGDTDDALEADFWASLRESLRAYLHFGDAPPLPLGAPPLPWEQQTVGEPVPVVLLELAEPNPNESAESVRAPLIAA